MPTIEARMPMTSDSASTEPRIWLREAPSVRSSANSRERWATVTAKVLKMRKPPTSTATAAKTSSAMRMKPSASERSWAAFSACSSPVRTAKPCAELAWIAALSSLGRRAARRRPPRCRCSRPRAARAGPRGASSTTMREPARLSESPRRATPEIVYCFSGSRPATVTVSPSLPAELVGRRLVDRDLVVGLRAGRPPCSRTGRTARARSRRRIVGGPLGDDQLALAVEQRRRRRRRSRRPPRRRRPTGRLERRGLHRRRRREVLLHGDPRLDRDVGALARALEQILERGVDRVGEDERARHEGHADARRRSRSERYAASGPRGP